MGKVSRGSLQYVPDMSFLCFDPSFIRLPDSHPSMQKTTYFRVSLRYYFCY